MTSSTQRTPTPAVPAVPPAPSAPPAPPAPPVPAESVASTTSITLEINGRQVSGELDDSATSASLIALLPLTLTFSDHGGVEKSARPPEPLSMDGAPDRSNATPLTIGYYSPDQVLVLYYDHVGTFAGIVPIGSFDDIGAVRASTSDFAVTVRPSN